MKFSEQYENIINEAAAVFSKEKYDWGELRKITKIYGFL